MTGSAVIPGITGRDGSYDCRVRCTAIRPGKSRGSTAPPPPGPLASAASGPDRCRIWAIRDGIVLSAWTAEALTTDIRRATGH